MTAVYILTGTVLLALGAGLFYWALPTNEQLTAVGRSKVLGELHAFAVVISLTLGVALLMVAVLR